MGMRRSDMLGTLALLAIAWNITCAIVVVANAQGTVYLPAVPSDATPTPRPTVDYVPPAGYACFVNWSGNAIHDRAAAYWTCVTEEHGACLFRAAGLVSTVVACREAPSGGGESMVDVEDGWGYFEYMRVDDDHARRGLTVEPIEGWVR